VGAIDLTRWLCRASMLMLVMAPALAQDDPDAMAGPCAAFAAPDGDIPSELPGCRPARHSRSADEGPEAWRGWPGRVPHAVLPQGASDRRAERREPRGLDRESAAPRRQTGPKRHGKGRRPHGAENEGQDP